MSEHWLRCSDLRRLGIDEVLDHDHEAQVPDGLHCGCWVDGPTVREGGESFTSAEYDRQSCGRILALPLPEHGTRISLCCTCAERVGDVWALVSRVNILLRDQGHQLLAAGGAR